MKFIKGYKLISQEGLSKLETDAEVRGAKESKQQIDELKRSIEKKNGEIDHLRQQQEDLCKTAERQIDRLEAKISVLEEERDEVREIEKQSLKNADAVAILNAKEESLDKREKLLDKREEKLVSRCSGTSSSQRTIALRLIGIFLRHHRERAHLMRLI